MKKLAIVGLAVLSTAAYASNGRIAGLGDNTNLWVDDTTRAFLNPASINGTNNYVIIEQGGDNTTAANERIEGGFMRSSGSFVYGAYMNNAFSNGSADEVDPGTTITAGSNWGGTAKENNGWDFFVGGDMGVQWGARLHYDSTAVDGGNTAFATEDTYSGLGLGLGIVMGDIDVYANLILDDEYKNITAADANETVTGGGMQIGAQYGMGSWTFMFDMNNRDKEWAQTTAGAAVANDADKYENKTMTIGAGHMHEVSSTARIMTTVAYVSNTRTWTDANAAATPKDMEIAQTSIPVTVAFEADANSWLTLRGSVRQSILGSAETTFTPNAAGTINKTNNVAGTEFTAGATLNFGKLKVDGILKAGDAESASPTNDDLNLDTVMTKVGITYWY